MRKLIDGMTEEEAYQDIIPLLRHLARPFGYRHGREDAESVASEGFVKAFRTYDPATEVPFRNFAAQTMMFELYKLGRQCPSGMHVSAEVQTLRHKITRLGLQEKPAEEIAIILNCSVSRARNAVLASDRASMLRLDAPTNTGTEGTDMTDVMGNVDDLSGVIVDDCLRRMTDRQKKIILGLMNEMHRTEIAEQIGVTVMTIHRDMKKAKAIVAEFYGMEEYA